MHALTRPEDLKPATYNPRTITPEALAGLKASIVQFGDIAGITWNRRTGNLVTGHQRMRSLRALYGDDIRVEDDTLVAPDGTRYPVRVVDWDEAKEMAANIAANSPHIGGTFDDEKLAAMLDGMKTEEFFKELRFDLLLPDTPIERGECDPDDVPDDDDVPTITQPGDLWILGDHRLLCGDSTKAEDIARLMAGDRAAMAFTDPPYNVAYEGAAGSIQNDNLGTAFGAFLEAAMRALLAHTDGGVYVCMSSSELDTLQAAFRAAGGHWSTFIIWAKDSFTLGRSDYQRQYEPILYGWRKGTRHYWNGDRNQGDVWFCEKPRRSELHPTMKPVLLVVRAIANSSPEGGVVLDSFGGSGTTLIAAEMTHRKARLNELDPKFCDRIVARWERFTGRKAERIPAAE